MHATSQELSSATCTLPVVFVHGFMQTPHEWDDVVGALEQYAAEGDTPSLDRDFVLVPAIAPTCAAEASLEALAADVCEQAQLVAQRAGAPGVILVGYSMGGRIALECLRQRPDLVSALVLESAGLGPESEEERAEIAQRNAAMAERLQAEGIERFVDWWETLPLFATQQHLDEAVRETIRTQRCAQNPQTLVLLLENAGAHTMPQANQTRRMLEQTSIPVRYITGTADPKYQQLASTLPHNVQVQQFDAGHNVHREQPAAYVAALADILAVIMRSLDGGSGAAQ